jgi:hypothetical protein
MRKLAAVLLIGWGLVAPAHAADPSASIPNNAAAGRWEGTAAEFPSPYLSTGTATVTLDLKPDGTFAQTWRQKGREWSTAGRWEARGDRVVLVTDDQRHTRLTLRRRGDTLYAVAAEPLPAEGRVATEAITLHRAAP